MTTQKPFKKDPKKDLQKNKKPTQKPKKPAIPHFYGIHAIKAILNTRPMDAKALFVQSYDNHQNADHADIIALATSLGVSVQTAQKDTLTELCGSPQHQGVVLSARPRPMLDDSKLDSLAGQDNAVFLVLDQITDPHNFGACLRTASAMGVTAVIVPRHQSVGLTPTVAKVSVGGSDAVPVVAVTNLARCLEKLKSAGVFVFGTALDESAKPLQACDFGGKVAIVMGSEGDGMRRLTGELCDTLVYIPMTDNPDRPQSLNVSVATGMVLWEVFRGR
ncbi:23S rRNA (guanosine-2'-O-)-methyltransferase RlmB [Moraxella lacunata]|uniref:23S rRNA (Guanosine-2'-O-)-methyltransferase RlmB n=1 Tax=Moraxella lacunata TaxID=477 RepID=A0A378TR56_MORLA|nr:23S rRNA (guanosine(2251)-2'-O)-methyltransferase RlmB [Moraxella lacunata]STZ63131.1 23S rRNA (guanosine-2'-O-)-methyltransferase RlmB [Moraxella lacunata]